jgi:hypothetical protein
VLVVDLKATQVVLRVEVVVVDLVTKIEKVAKCKLVGAMPRLRTRNRLALTLTNLTSEPKPSEPLPHHGK